MTSPLRYRISQWIWALSHASLSTACQDPALSGPRLSSLPNTRRGRCSTRRACPPSCPLFYFLLLHILVFFLFYSIFLFHVLLFFTIFSLIGGSGRAFAAGSFSGHAAGIAGTVGNSLRIDSISVGALVGQTGLQ